MKANDKMLFCTLLTSVAELYGKHLEANSLDIYWHTLKKYSLETIRRAVQFHVTNQDNGQFMPKPADLLRYIEESNDIKSLHAWDKVVLAMQKVGAQNSIEFDDPAIHVVINEMGGWITICYESDNKKLPFKAIEFQRRYSAYLIHPLPPAPKHLCGIIEHLNRIYEYYDRIPKPVFFGKKEMILILETSNTPEKLHHD